MADETGKAIKLTRDDLRSIDVGKTKTFYLLMRKRATTARL